MAITITPLADLDASEEYSFSGQTKHNKKARTTATLSRIREFMSSNGLTIYTVSLWDDGGLSCNCPSWSFRRPKKARTCKHCKDCREDGEASMTALDGYTQPIILGPPSRQPRERGIRGVRLQRGTKAK